MVALLVLTTILIFLTIDYIAQRAHAPEAEAVASAPRSRPAADLTRVPGDTWLAPGHVWARVEPYGTVRLGTDRLAGTLLGAVDRAAVVRQGSEVHVGDPIATVAHGARTITLRSPVDGVVTAVNEELASDPNAVLLDPFGNGWMARIRPVALGPAMKRMFVAEDAGTFLRDELRKLRELLTAAPALQPAMAATLPDGGLPADGLAEHLDDRTWSAVAAGLYGAPAMPVEARA
jgi:glycine cleavage system H protein